MYSLKEVYAFQLYDIPVIDLYGLLVRELDKYIRSKGNVHYKPEGYELMAEKINSDILKLTGK